MTNYFPRTPSPNTITLEIVASVYEFWRDAHILSKAHISMNSGSAFTTTGYNLNTLITLKLGNMTTWSNTRDWEDLHDTITPG